MNRPVRTRMSESSLILIGIPRKFHEMCIEDFVTYDNSDLKRVKDFMIDYIKHLPDMLKSNQGICLFGSNGVGKTMLSCMIVKEAYRLRYTARRVTFMDYIEQYTKTWSAKTVEEKESFEDNLYNNFKAVDFLVIEEIGKEFDSSIAAPILEDLLRYREDHSLVTVICSNISPKDMKSRYGASVSSLMKGNMTPVKIEGVDKRQEFYEDRKEEEFE